MILFGAKSPLVVELEESLDRAGVDLLATVHFDDASRAMDRSRLVFEGDLTDALTAHPFLPCAFAPKRRRELARDATSRGFHLADALVDPTAIVAKSANLAQGVYVTAAAIIGAVALIREGAFVNRAASVGHHCIIGSYCSIGPGANLASNIILEDDVIIGTGATIIPDIHVGEGAVIGAGAIVAKDVPANALVRPARSSIFENGAVGLPLAEGAQE